MQASTLGVAIVLVVPAVAYDGYSDTLRANLERTIRALEGLAGIEADLENGDPRGIDAILAWTEPASEDGIAQERQLVELRSDVNELQVRADRQGGGQFLTPPPAARSSFADAEEDAGQLAPRSMLPPTTGLSRSDRVLLLPSRGSGSNALGAPAPTSAATTALGEPVIFEDEEYAADGVRLARVLFRQAKFEDALRQLGGNEEVEALYWRARCLEKLGRSREALDIFRRVAEMPEAGTTGESARHHADFLEWKVDFLLNQSATGPGS